jgi:ribonucleotide reductase beta subunit family protein with ferritin-like domain
LKEEFDFNQITKIRTPTESYTRHYPEIVALANKQLEEQLWFSSEMVVELDRMQLLYELSEDQLHAVKTVLQLFLRYELIVGEEFWNGLMIKTFPRPEVKLAASILGMTELAIHAEFYNQINVQLGLDKDEDYIAYIDDPELKGRIDWLQDVLSGDDKVLACTIFGLTETALLFSSFAILKSFQSNGYNLIPVIARGANQSAVDEDLHGMVAAEIINTYYAELGTTLKEDTERASIVYQAVQYAFEHECRIINMAIPSGKLNGQTVGDYMDYLKVRLNLFCTRVGLDEPFPGVVSKIAEWFEQNTYAYKVIDFFSAGMGQEYESSWNEQAFIAGWKEGKEGA